MAALKRCVFCRLPVSKKKLTTIDGGRPAHRACCPAPTPDTRTVTVTFTPIRVGPGSSPAFAGLPQAPKQKQMSRATLLKRIEELRKADARKQAKTATRQQPHTRAKPKPKPKPTSKPTASGSRTGASASTPPPYYGVEMKKVDGRWVQQHPESE
ncbi:hypothetical protein [Streptomyces filamentosus]|uniref:hypothetical protein n=1 Tax=Streptomyces filamentosus TaxID=67294 RepID=UPI0033C6658D